MQIAKTNEMKPTRILAAGDVVDFGGVMYTVIENVPCPFSFDKRNITLANMSMTYASEEDRLFMIVPDTTLVTIYQV